MAKIAVTSDGILSPQSLELWLFGGIMSMTTQSVVVFNPASGSGSTSYTGVYSGNFGMTIAGNITGQITGFTFLYKTTPFLTFSELAVDAGRAFHMVGTGDAAGLSALLFADDDQFSVQIDLDGYGYNQAINGFGGNDLIHSSLGADLLSGGLGKDTLFGGLSQDSLQGDAGDDLLYGESGNDSLSGGAGRDMLSGGWDNDTLIGGTGADQIYGGFGADLFVWTSLREFPAASAGRDVVHDFSAADGDKIDLFGIDAKAGVKGNQAFVLADAFSQHAGELCVQTTATGSLISGDTDGDGSADFSIAFLGGAAFSITDFVL